MSQFKRVKMADVTYVYHSNQSVADKQDFIEYIPAISHDVLPPL